jgi:hypothetical protein
MTQGPPSRNLPTPPNGLKSLADDSTAIAAVSVVTKQPTEFQVLTESCEWCLVTTPWTGDDDEDLIDAAVNTQQPNSSQDAELPKMSVNTSALGKMYGTGQANKCGANNASSRKTLGPRMI